MDGAAESSRVDGMGVLPPGAAWRSAAQLPTPQCSLALPPAQVPAWPQQSWGPLHQVRPGWPSRSFPSCGLIRGKLLLRTPLEKTEQT